MDINDVIEKLKEYYEEAKALDYIKKPISWALYKTWNFSNEKEKERE